MRKERTKAGVRVRPMDGLFPPAGDEAMLCHQRRELSLPPAAWRIITATAAELGVSRSAFMAFASAYFIQNAKEAGTLMLPL